MPAKGEAKTSPSAPSTPETPNDTAKDGNAPETGTSGDQTPNDPLQDALESFGGKSFVDLLRIIDAHTEDPDEKAAVAELIAMVDAHPGLEDDFMLLAAETMLKQETAQRAKLYDVTPTFPLGGTFSTSESLLPESDEDRAERVRANAAAELEELKEASRQRGEAAEAQREAAGAEAQADRRNK